MKTTLFVLASTALLSTGALAAGSPATQSQAPGAKQAQAQAPAAKQDQPAAQSQSSAEGAGKQQAGQAMSPDVVKKAQQALKDKGHDVGAIDGQYGPRTAQGVKKFQESEKLKVTGRLDQETLSALGVESSATGGSSAGGAGSAGGASMEGKSSPGNAGAAPKEKAK